VSGKNVVSGFGDYNKGMEKSLERFKETAAAKGFGTEEDPDLDRLKTYYENRYGPIRDNAVLQRLTHARQMTGGNDGNNWIDETDGGSFKTGDRNYGFDDSGSFTGEGFGGSSGPSENYGYDDSGSFTGEGFSDSSGPSEDYGFDDSGGFTGEGWAQGGRIGYNRGRVVNPGGYAGMSMFEAWLKDQYGMGVRDIKDWNLYAGLSREWNRLGGSKADGGIAGLL
jgi:hypothetical protein